MGIMSKFRFLVLVLSLTLGWASSYSKGQEKAQIHYIDADIPKSFDCKVKQLALELAFDLQAWRGKTKMMQVYNALALGLGCNITFPSRFPVQSPPVDPQPPAPDMVVYVDPLDGLDSNEGTQSQPVKSISKALEITRKGTTLKSRRTITLRAGTHYLTQPIAVTPTDNGLTITSHKGEEVWLSGGVPLHSLVWTQHDRNVWSTSLASFNLKDVPGLRLNGGRVVRARSPNGDPETTGRHTSPTGYFDPASVAQWHPMPRAPPPLVINVSTPFRPHFQDADRWHVIGIGGTCQRFTPPSGRFCIDDRSTTRGMTYANGLFPSDFDATGAEIHYFPRTMWSTVMFPVASHDGNNTLGWDPMTGGFQEPAGSTVGAEWRIENHLHLLDHPNEFYFSPSDQKLFFYVNGTGPPPVDGFVATNLRRLIEVCGSQTNPVIDVTIFGLKFRDTRQTYLDPHGMPSSGGWALERDGAIFVEGTQGLKVSQCLWERIDGNGMMISGYHRDMVIDSNEFHWIGGSAMATWGDTQLIDATNGDQPWNTTVTRNFVHEIGIFQKQSAAWHQSQTMRTTLKYNIFFNGPRAAVNFNDGMGGGNHMAHNLIFGMVRETKDHGPFNSWDRSPYLTTIVDGKTPSLAVIPHQLERNLIIAAWGANWVVDNDDSSSHYDIHHNVLVYSSGLKTEGSGHAKTASHNIYAYAALCACHCSKTPYPLGAPDQFLNNTCIMRVGQLPYVMDGSCNSNDVKGSNPIVTRDNKVMCDGMVNISCGDGFFNFDEWQQRGGDVGSTLHGLPKDQEVIDWARDLLAVPHIPWH